MSTIRSLALVVLICLLIALAITGVESLKFRADCHRDGGTFHTTPTLLTCTY